MAEVGSSIPTPGGPGWRLSILLTLPLFAIYELGLLLVNQGQVRNAADVLLKGLLGLDEPKTVRLLHLGVMGAFIASVWWPSSNRDEAASPGVSVVGRLGLVILESSAYAVLLLPVSQFAGQLASLGSGAGRELFERILLSVGAGLYEEIAFRLIPLTVGFLCLHRVLGMERLWAQVVLIIVTSLVFSHYHHWGGDPIVAKVFAFRFLAGVLLSFLFLYRGFAVACWTHVLYDELCLLLGSN